MNEWMKREKCPWRSGKWKSKLILEWCPLHYVINRYKDVYAYIYLYILSPIMHKFETTWEQSTELKHAFSHQMDYVANEGEAIVQFAIRKKRNNRHIGASTINIEVLSNVHWHNGRNAFVLLVSGFRSVHLQKVYIICSLQLSTFGRTSHTHAFIRMK